MKANLAVDKFKVTKDLVKDSKTRWALPNPNN